MNGADCFGSPPQPVVVQPGDRASIRIVRTGTTTLLLRGQFRRHAFIGRVE
jgi:hypothetical protein